MNWQQCTSLDGKQFLCLGVTSTLYFAYLLSLDPMDINHHDPIFMDFTATRDTQWRRQWQPTPVLLPRKWTEEMKMLLLPWTEVHGVAKSQTRLSNFTFTFHFHALNKQMATHSSVLAWRIPGTVGPGGLPSMGSHRVGHDWSNLAAAAAEILNNVICLVKIV